SSACASLHILCQVHTHHYIFSVKCMCITTYSLSSACASLHILCQVHTHHYIFSVKCMCIT
ncbi:predicted protein, partial [Nematostella vectensis]